MMGELFGVTKNAKYPGAVRFFKSRGKKGRVGGCASIDDDRLFVQPDNCQRQLELAFRFRLNCNDPESELGNSSIFFRSKSSSSFCLCTNW